MSALNGIDVLVRDGFRVLKGRRIGLITNHTGLSADLKPTVDLLNEAPEVDLTVLFGPEHGIRGEWDEHVPDSKDEKTGLPVYSLYGMHKKPTPEMLQNVDALVYDVQDIGCRFYTYSSTLGYAVEAAAEAKIPLFVLDRVNPINGIDVEGPIADPDKLSFIAYHEVPVRHGMTLGELAQLFNSERGIGAELNIIQCENWRRADWYDSTGLYWVNPSPSMRSLSQATFYPGIGLLETTNVSVGRGTDAPFEFVGAPWMNGRQLAEAMNARRLPGVRFVPVQFTPNYRELKGEICEGINLIITDRRQFQSVLTGIELACALRDLYPTHWSIDKFLNLLVNQKALDALKEGLPAPRIEAGWQEDLNAFKSRRQAFLIYD